MSNAKDLHTEPIADDMLMDGKCIYPGLSETTRIAGKFGPALVEILADPAELCIVPCGAYSL